MACYVVDRLCGPDVVEVTVKGMEYNWGRDPHKPLPEDLT
jgi:hypothetical protein